MKIKTPILDRQSGQSAVELALLLPVLMLILLAILEVGRVVDAWVVATNAAREGARYAAYGETAGTVNGKVTAYLAKGLAGRTDVVLPTAGEITISNARGMPGSATKVVVPVKVNIFTPLVADLGFGNPIVVRGQATMRIQ